MFILYENQRLTDGSNIELVARKRYEFVCVVPGIKPAASIRWTLNGMPETGVESVVQVGGNLVNSSSNLTIDIPEAAEVSINCSATNRQTGPMVPEVEVVLNFMVAGTLISPHTQLPGVTFISLKSKATNPVAA